MESKSETIEKQIEENAKPHLESVLYNMTLVEVGEGSEDVVIYVWEKLGESEAVCTAADAM